MTTYSIGVIGYSAQEFDKQEAHSILLKAVARIIESGVVGARELEIVSGLSYMGVPAVAYDFAEYFGFRTVGIACTRSLKYECYPCDEVIIVGDQRDQEAPALLERVHTLVRIGGGEQSLNEVQIAKNLGMIVMEYELEVL